MKVDDGNGSRPYAYADPRSLSRAWYDALYAAHPQAQKRLGDDAHEVPANATLATRNERAETAGAEEPVLARTSPQRASAATSEREAIEGEDAPAAAVRRKTRTAVAADAPEARDGHRSDIDIDDGHGGLKLLVSQRGAGVEVVAICERAARERTADALARARIALQARGIDVNATLREKSATPLADLGEDS